MSHRLYLLDGMALVYRAHFALIRSPIYTSGRVNASALFGFTNTLLDILDKQKPSHLGLVFDTSAPTERHVIFPEYKAQRDEMPEDLAKAIPEVKRLARAFNIPVIEKDGFEADDIIGTLARRADLEGGFDTFMVTPDKDFAQLVTEHTSIYKPGRKGSEFEILGVPEILAKWEVERPEQVIDILGLWGDASDNIPGVPGIGEKTAKKLMAKYGSVEGLLEHSSELKGKQKENVEANKEQALLSKRLATIILDVPVEVSFEELRVTELDAAAVQQIFTEFEFNHLGKRLFGDSYKAGRGGAGVTEEKVELKNIDSVEHTYETVETAKRAAQVVAKFDAAGSFCFDLETSSLDPRTTEIIGVALSNKAHTGFYFNCRAKDVLKTVVPLLMKAGVEKIGHNLKFDLSCLVANGIEAVGPFFDTMLVHSLVEPDQRHGMDFLSEHYLGYTPVPISELIGEKRGKEEQLSMLDIVDDKSEELAKYAAEDADVTWQLADVLRPKLDEAGLAKLYREIEAPLLPVLTAMENAGVAIDVGALAEISEELGKRVAELDATIQEEATQPLNVASPKQLGTVLFDVLQLAEKPKKTKTGQYKTDEATLQTLVGTHPIIEHILEYRESSKLKNTYVDTLPEAVNSKTGRVHTSYHQLMTATGRLASSNPNLQNIPVRSEQGREIRRAFVPGKKGWKFLSADYSQVELRVMASVSEDEAMMEAFQQELDIHTATAAKVYGVELDGVLPEMRRTAKMVNFGIIYGISAFGLSQRLGIPRGEASEIIETYFAKYPGVKAFMENVVTQAKEDGFVETLTGRRRVLRDINSGNGNIQRAAERTAINTPIQGTAADMIKIAMCRVSDALRESDLETTLLLQVHDELVLEMPAGEEDAVRPLVEKAMREALPLKVPVLVETGVGDDWLEAH